MNSNENAKLHIISSISEEYIDEATAQRIASRERLLKRKAVQIRIMSVAAVFILFFSALIPILLIGFSKNVPVYTGMTVSSEPPEVNAGQSLNQGYAAPLSCITRDTKTAYLSYSTRKKKPIKDALSEHFVINENSSLYYAYPGEDIYITVNFDNPNNYEILSFTLNGQKYTSYMFEEGSDMENIVLKINVGDVSGLVSYTIDAIKYVDGDKIKDVKMNGERTVNIGVYNPSQPTASISDIKLTENSISFNAEIFDEKSLIAATKGKAYAVIYNGSEITEKLELPLGKTKNILFNNLSAAEEYTVAVVAVFDSYDGAGTNAHILCQESFSTDPAIYPVFIKTEKNTVHFELRRQNKISSFIRLELIDSDGAVIKSSETELSEFENIPRGKFKLRLTYSYTDNGAEKICEKESEEFFCLAGMQPTVGTVIKDFSEEPVYNTTTDDMREHKGVDISAKENADVFSMSDGTVTAVYNDDYYGFSVEVTDKFGYKYIYQCLNEAVAVSVGDEVLEMDIIGTVGASAITEIFEGYHLHFAMKDPDGSAIKPEFSSIPIEPEPTPEEKIQKAIDENEWLKSQIMYVIIPQRGDKVYTEYFSVINGSDVKASFAMDSEYLRIILANSSGFILEYDFTNITAPTDVHFLITLSCEDARVELDCVISLVYSLPDEEEELTAR